ncbi:MAG: MotA/TolQ/ExbB proton channel family protein [Bacteroidia bacterium]
MKKLTLLLAVFSLCILPNTGFAQNDTGAEVTDTMVADSIVEMDEQGQTDVEEAPIAEPEEVEETEGAHKIIKEKFIQGGPWMWPVLLCLIIGLAVAIERIIVLNMKTVNRDKFMKRIETALSSGGIDKAKSVARDTRGPIASIYYQGLDRSPEGIDIVEKSIVSYGSVEMGRLEQGLVWISLFIAIAPMLGFMGTVIGMIDAFDSIEAAGDISPSLVAAGIKVALLTTVAGLIVAIILQVFYNYLVSKVDSMVNDMEDSSIMLVDMLIKYNVVKTFKDNG